MRICPSTPSAANRFVRSRHGQIGKTCALLALAAATMFGMPCGAFAQNMVMPAAEPGSGDNGGAPMAASGDVSFFSQDLGTILRLRYSTESYGQQEGNFDVGSMQVITFDDAAVIADGQVTMNDQDGVGFNVGAGYRWMDFPMVSPEGRVEGVGLFADGQHTEPGNFFPQIGVSLESLGELWDFRGNIYVPLGAEKQVGNFKPTNAIGFQGNSLSELTQAGVDTSFTVGEIEIARRLGAERDAWAFVGPYFVANSDDSAAGYRVGVRGYAYPDLLLQFALSNDDIFHTEASFSLQWFVGRTRTNFQPAGNVADRIREPFMRNDYVALQRSTQAGGNALTNTDGTALRFVHVASNAAAGGNGTAERPFNELDEANGTGSQTGDIILAHSASTFSTPIILKDNQKLLGEGNNFNLTVATQQRGTISIPETSPGSKALARPIINIPSSTDAITLANNNEIVNFDMNGQNNAGTRAIAAAAGGSGNPNIHDLAISNTTGDAIFFKPDSFVDTTDSNANGSTTDIIVPGNVTINNLTLTNIVGSGVHVDSTAPVDITLPNTTLQETIALSNITSTSTVATATGTGINLENTHAGHATTLTGYNYNGGTTGAGGLRLNNFDGTFSGSTSTLTGGASTGTGLQIVGDTDSTNITFASTWAMTGITGTDVDIDGRVAGVDSLGATITFANAINNTAGRSISVQGATGAANISFNGDITDTGTGILVNSNNGGEIAFVGAVKSTISTAGATAVTLTNNTGANIDFAGATGSMTIVATDDPTDPANPVNGFIATGGGTISAGSTTNSITTGNGQALNITGMTIAAGGFNVGDINRNGTAATTNAIHLENNTGLSSGSGGPVGAIVIGNTPDTTPGDAGTIKGGTADAVFVKDSANVSITGLKIDNTGNTTIAGINVVKSNTVAMTTDLSSLEIDGGATGIDTFGPGTGAVTMTINDTAINGSALAGTRFTGLAAGTVTGTGVTIDGKNATPGADGVQINGSNATITFDTTSLIKNFQDNDFEVSGGTGTIAFNGTIQNSSTLNAGDTSGHSINVHNITGGSVTFGTGTQGTITDNNLGFFVHDNTGGTISVAGAANTINTTGTTNDAVTITNNTGATINMGPLAITTTAGRDFVATGGGTLSVIGTTNTVTRNDAGGTTGAAVDIEGMTIGAVDFQSVNATGGANGTFFLNNTGGNITIGTPGNAVNAGGTIQNTAAAGVHAENSNVTLNGVTVTNAGTSANAAIEYIHNNTTAMTGAVNNVTITNNTVGQNGLNVDGHLGSGTFTFTSGGSNNITTNTGVGLAMNTVAIGPANSNFDSVTVTNGATNGINLQNVTNTGGQGTVTVGTNAGAQNSGGKLTTTQDAIVLNNVASAAFQHVQIVSAGGEGVNIDHTNLATSDMAIRFTDLNLDASTGAGFDVAGASNTHALSIQLLGSDLERNVVMNITGAGAFNMVTDGTSINTTGTDIAFALNFTGSGPVGNATFTGANNFTAGNASALSVVASGATARTIGLNVNGGQFNNASAGSAAAAFTSTGSTTLNATIQSNIFDDATVGGQDFAMTSNGAQARILLNLGGDTPTEFNTANGQGDYELHQQAGSTFRIFHRDDTLNNLRNNGTVNQNGGTYIDNSTPPLIPTPPSSP